MLLEPVAHAKSLENLMTRQFTPSLWTSITGT